VESACGSVRADFHRASEGVLTPSKNVHRKSEARLEEVHS
jgi:hypothetical protein